MHTIAANVFTQSADISKLALTGEEGAGRLQPKCWGKRSDAKDCGSSSP
jgi:hypothetical protein